MDQYWCWRTLHRDTGAHGICYCSRERQKNLQTDMTLDLRMTVNFLKLLSSSNSGFTFLSCVVFKIPCKGGGGVDISEFRSCYLCSNYLKHKYCMRERNVLGFFFSVSWIQRQLQNPIWKHWFEWLILLLKLDSLIISKIITSVKLSSRLG